MTQFDDKIREEFLKQEKLPSVVEDKWSTAAADILAGRVQQKKAGPNKVLFICLKSTGCVAAALVILFSVAYINPVFAENIPVLRDVIRYLKNTELKTYVPAVATAPDVVENIQPVTPVEKETALSIEEAYCDGSVLVFTAILEPGAVAADYDAIGVQAALTLNGMDATKNMLHFGLQKTEDGAYVGLFTVDVARMDLTDTIHLQFTISEAMYRTKNYVLSNYDVMLEEYGSEEALLAALNAMDAQERQGLGWEEEIVPVTLPAGLSFTGTVTTDRTKTKVYPVNKEENGCAVRTLSASPTCTKLDLTTPEDVTYILTDNMGNRIKWLKLGSYDWTTHEALLNGTTSVTIRFYSLNDRITPIASFEIPVEGGFVEKSDFRPGWATYKEEDYTYTPPIAPLPADWLNRGPEDTVVTLGEPFTLAQHNDGKPGPMQEITYSNMQVFDSMEDAGLDPACINPMFTEDGGPNIEGKKFVTLELHIKNLEGPQYGLSLLDYGWISQKQPGLSRDQQPITELAYFSDTGKSVNNFYYADIQFDEEYNGTIGFYWDTEDLYSGNLQITMVRYKESEAFHTVVDFPPYEG